MPSDCAHSVVRTGASGASGASMRRWPATMAEPSVAKSSESPSCDGTIPTVPSPFTEEAGVDGGRRERARPRHRSRSPSRAGSTASARPVPSGWRVVVSAAASCSGVTVTSVNPWTISNGALSTAVAWHPPRVARRRRYTSGRPARVGNATGACASPRRVRLRAARGGAGIDGRPGVGRPVRRSCPRTSRRRPCSRNALASQSTSVATTLS